MLPFSVPLLGTSTVASKYEELECLYAAVGKVIYEGLTNYEKATSSANPTQLFGKTPTRTKTHFYFLCRLLFSLALIHSITHALALSGAPAHTISPSSN
jgi:hypothetical protein